MEIHVADWKLPTWKNGQPVRHLCENLKIESLIFTNSFSKEIVHVEDLRQSGQVDEIPRLRATEYGKNLVHRKFLIG